MNTTFIALTIAILIGMGLLIGIGALSLLSGALNFLLVKPQLIILKSKFGSEGFAFKFYWKASAENYKMDQLRIQLFNPFGTPKQFDLIREFDPSVENFARDLNLGKIFFELLNSKDLKNGSVEIEISSSKDLKFFRFNMKASEFVKKCLEATLDFETAQLEFINSKKEENKSVPIPERSFISPPLPKSAKALKLATNPEFAGAFLANASGSESAGAGVANYSVSKVWIEPGCIVCDACEGIYPEVFEVTDSTCLIRPGAPLTDGLKIQEAAEACPVEVIKFTKAG